MGSPVLRNVFLITREETSQCICLVTVCNLRSCIGSELVDQLLEHCPFVQCRSTAIGVWQLLLDMGILSSACAFQYNRLSFVYLIYLLFIPLFLEPTKATIQGSTWEKAFRQIDFERNMFVAFMEFFTEKLRVVYKTQASNRQILVQTIYIKRQSDWSGEFFLEDPGLRDSLLNEDLTYIHIMAGGGKIDSEEVLIYEEDLDEGDGTEGDLEESTKLKLFCRLASMASKLREFIGNMITTAGKVVLKILLGSSGMMLPSLTSSVYFFVFLGLCTWWSWCRTFDPLLFSYLCVLLPSSPQDTWSDSICTSSQFFQEAIPHNDYYARLRGIAGHLKIPEHSDVGQVEGLAGEPVSTVFVIMTERMMEPEKEEEEEPKEEQQEQREEEEEVDEQDVMKVLGNLLLALFIRYWVYICRAMFFFISFEGKIVMYKIIYMVLLLFYVALYQTGSLSSEPQRKPSDSNLHRPNSMSNTASNTKNELDFAFRHRCTEWWRQILKYFWMSVVICMMPVLIFIHAYQFENFPGLWQNMIGLKKEKLEDLGLKQFRVAELFTGISISTSFLPVCVPHLHYFHGWFLELTNLKSIPSKEDSAIYRDNEDEDEDEDKEGEEEEETSDLRNNWHLVIDHLTVLLLWFLEGFYQLLTFLLWTLELHIIKIMYSCIIWVPVKEASDAALSSGQTQQVSLFNYVFLVSWAFTLPYAKLCHVASSVCTVWTCVIIVCKMLYQLQTIKPENFSVNCSLPNENQTNIPLHQLNKPLLYSTPTDPTERMDLRKSSPLLVHLRNNLLMLAILAFKVTIYCHQEYYQGWNNLSTPVSKTIYHNITRLQLDDGLVNCARYFINYFFHKFGLEIFEDENKAAIWIMAGDNVEICMNLDAASFSQHNPVPDFIHCRSYLDISMVVIFSYPFWFVLTVIFITGMTHISIFCTG
ncbi:hypothetical protein MG293_005407 [Ovis ammon polii]|uniref:DEP domain-containing protein n=1 Tax=Ovis ammon polii TaxID=230172 RepID=A0AAD4YFY2_OVIAM|nr:hypothetical protein MG293_005407 [Ovis ammon polii]